MKAISRISKLERIKAVNGLWPVKIPKIKTIFVKENINLDAILIFLT